ncbi:MAG: cysteine--tRNA ligase [Candidatus Vogelbacteria bacterium]|nr:cysteine--tRNA ligase [Candidatus Vogelbacteria bacterium]
MDIEKKIFLYNTLSRKKEEFIAINKGHVGLYLCGPTVYDYATIGNYRTYIMGDLINRVFTYNNYKVTYVQNITDVGHLVGDNDEGEDKLEKGARREGKTAREVADFFTENYKGECKLLNIKNPDIWCRATDHIKEQLDMIVELEKKGFTYKTSDGIYFDTSKQSNYDELAKLDIEGLKVGARVEINQEKKSITDFALWKFSPKDEKRHMEWSSPWGIGFPGWHVECSAMSIKYLGEPFDIHAGAIDLIPVHHTNEIAQNEAVYGNKTVNYWVHGGFLMVDGGKMGKSLGNTYRIEEIITHGYDPIVFRYLTYTAHYRQPLNFSWESLKQASNSYSKLIVTLYPFYNAAIKLYKEGKINDGWNDKFTETINDDLNMPRALAVVWDMLRVNRDGAKTLATILKFDEILGLQLNEKIEDFGRQMEDIPRTKELSQLLDQRNEARRAKDWKKSDDLRDTLERLGYIVSDTPDGTTLTPKK